MSRARTVESSLFDMLAQKHPECARAVPLDTRVEVSLVTLVTVVLLVGAAAVSLVAWVSAPSSPGNVREARTVARIELPQEPVKVLAAAAVAPPVGESRAMPAAPVEAAEEPEPRPPSRPPARPAGAPIPKAAALAERSVAVESKVESKNAGSGEPPRASSSEMVEPERRPGIESASAEVDSGLTEQTVPTETLTPPVRLFAPAPSYPTTEWSSGFEGDVKLKAKIDETGRVRDVQVVEGVSAGLDSAAITALERWRFRPAERGGQAVPFEQILTFRFRR